MGGGKNLYAAVVHEEHFAYEAGSALEGQGGWTVSAKTEGETKPGLLIGNTELTKENYGGTWTNGVWSSEGGLSVVVPSTVAADRTTYQLFNDRKSYKSGALYLAFLLNVSEPSANARDFLTFEGSTGTTQRARVFTCKSGTGYKLGIARASTSPLYIDGLELNKTYLAVVKYEFVEGACNDVASLFVDFPLGYREASAEVQSRMVSVDETANTSTDPSSLKGISIKQRVGGSKLTISHIRVATTWEEAVNYTGSEVQEDPDPIVYHFQEGFDSNGQWTVVNGGSSTTQNNGLFGTGVRSLTFNRTADRDRCNGATVLSPAVETAGVLRFWTKGSANETRANILVSKVIGTDTTDLAYIAGPFNKEWTEHIVVVNDPSEDIRILLTMSGCDIGTGSLYIDDASLTRYSPGAAPEIGTVYRSVPFPDTQRLTSILATITSPVPTRSIATAKVEWGRSPSALEETVAMSKGADDIWRSGAIEATHEGETIYYRIVAIDDHYISDTSAVDSFVVLKGYANAYKDTLTIGESTQMSTGLTGVRVNYRPLSGADWQTTGDMAAEYEAGEIWTWTNPLSETIEVEVQYGTFVPVVFSERPVTLQLYPRNTTTNQATVQIAGTTKQSDLSTLTFILYRNGVEKQRETLAVSKGVPFQTQFAIEAEAADYRFVYVANGGNDTVLLAEKVCAGDVYLIAGQSNGAAAASGNPGVTNTYWRNFGTVQKTVAYNEGDTIWGLSNSTGWGYGKLFYNGYSGYVLQRILLEEQQMPTAVLNVAIGGSSLNQNLPNEENHADLTTFYGEGLYRCRKAGIADAVRAIIWVQGESDQNGVYDTYAERFDQLYRAWKTDYPNVEHIYMSQINVGCGASEYASELREVQRRIAAENDDITLITNVGIPIRYDSCHYEDAGYERLYGQYATIIQRDLYGREYTQPITSPQVQSVRYNAQQTEITMTFDQPMVWPEVMWNRDMKDYFFDERGQQIPVSEGLVNPSNACEVVLRLTSRCTATHLTYGPDNYVYSTTRGMDTLYVDPWLRNEQGFAAVTFDRYPIADAATSFYQVSEEGYVHITDGVLYVEPKAGTVSQIRVLSMDGRCVAATNEACCDMRGLGTGIYMVEFRLSTGRTVYLKARNRE
ncbi:MAG: sialate O-acetylesterase [Paludibacteraceae bacterium]